MKVALVHDYIKEYGGAERVLEAMHELYPDAPVYTSVYLPEFLGPHQERFAKWDIRTSFLQNFPLKAKLISPMRLLAPWAFSQFDFSAYEVVIVSATGAYTPNMINKKNAVQICYCHTPPRYLYGYATAREWKNNPVIKIIAEIANHFLRQVDFTSSQHVDYFIANSEEVKRRISKFYRKEAVVMYPPVALPNSKFEIRNSKQTKNTKYKLQNTSYYITGGRLARPKHVDLIIKTCIENNWPLKVFGKAFAGYGEELRVIAEIGNRNVGRGKNSREKRQKTKDQLIQFMGEVSDKEKYKLMAGAKAFLFAAEDEDSGITPIEALAVGTPVVAYKSGGIVEKLSDGETGVFFTKLDTKHLTEAIKKLEQLSVDSKDCEKQASQFSKTNFLKQVSTFVTSITPRT